MRTQTTVNLVLLMVALNNAASQSPAEDKLAPLNKAASERISYRKDVLPIVKRHCWGCHSSRDAQGGLSMDSVKMMLKGGESGPLFEPGKPDKSLLVEMIAGSEPSMPKKQPPLSAAKIDLLRGWILAGAKDDSASAKPHATVSIPETYTYAPPVTSMTFRPDGKVLAVACRSEVILLDLAGKLPPKRLPSESELLTHVEFSSDGKLLVASGGSPSQYGEVRFYDATTSKLLSKNRVGNDTFFRGCISPDNQTLALGGADGAVHLLPVDSKKPIRRLELHSDWVMDVAFSGDGLMLVSGGRDKATKVSSVKSGQLLRSVDSSTESVNSVAANMAFAISSGRSKSLASYEFKIAVTDVGVTGAGNGAKPVTKKNQYMKPFEAQPGEVLDMASSHDGKLVAVVGNFSEARVYSIADRKRIATISKLSAPVFSTAISRDGKTLAVGTAGGKVNLFELPTGKPLRTIQPVPVAGGS